MIFSCSKFYGEVTNFTESIFGTVQFSFAEFHSNETYFFGTKFNSDVDFLSVTISSNKTFFIKAEFKGRTIFASTLFSGNIVNFGNSKFLNNYVSFDHCQISCKHAWFENVYFKAVKINFDDAYINNVNGLFESLRFKTKLGIIKYKIDNFRFNLGEETAKTNPVLARKSRDAWYINDFKSEHPNVYFIWNLSSKCGESLYRWTLWSNVLLISAIPYPRMPAIFS